MSITITVEGMSCGHCEETVEDALRKVEGVRAASADREADRVRIEGDVEVATLVRAVEDAGYTASA